MGYVFNSGPYSVDSCVDEKHLSRPDQCGPIPEIVPLLPKPELPPRDHRIFLSVCRSPWRFLNQKALACIRIAIAFYLTTILALGLFCELRNASFGKLYAFEVGNVSLMVQAVYYWISSVWTLQHLIEPNYFRVGEHLEGGIYSKVEALLGSPKLMAVDSKKRIGFSVFYTAAVTFPFLVTIMYWLVLFQPDPAVGPMYFDTAALKYSITTINMPALHYFVLINVYGVSACIAFCEIIILSSAHKQKPLAQHVEGILVVTIAYLIWAVLGRLITGEYVYLFLDPRYAGWRALVRHDLALLSHTITAFFFQRALHGLREKVVWKTDCDWFGR